MFRFMRARGFADYDELYRWSIDNSAAFWEALCDFCAVSFDTPADVTLANPGDIMHAGWFSGSKLNYSEHLLRHSGERAALVFCGEDGVRAAGVVKGDRDAGFLPNCPEAIIAMLAAAGIGAIWSSCSPDFGVNGVVDRFGQMVRLSRLTATMRMASLPDEELGSRFPRRTHPSINLHSPP